MTPWNRAVRYDPASGRVDQGLLVEFVSSFQSVIEALQRERIEALVRAYRGRLDHTLVGEYFELFERTAEFEALWQRIHEAE